MIPLFLLQFALPLVLIGWMALAPQRTLFGFWIQSIASAAALWAMALLGIWLLPPWWAPYGVRHWPQRLGRVYGDAGASHPHCR